MAEVRVAVDGEAYAAMKSLTMAGLPFTVVTTEAWSEPVFEPGDPVRVPFDNGWGPATVLGVSESYGERYVRVKYGPKGKYTTSIGAGSVQTDNRVEHPATLRVEPCDG